MAQNVLVDLDLNGNSILDLADGVGPNDAVNLAQVQDLITAADAPLPDPGDGLIGDATAYNVGAGAGIVVNPDDVAVDTAWLATEIGTAAPAHTVTAADASIATTNTGNSSTVGAVVSPTAGNQLALDAGGLYVPTPAAADFTGYVKDDGTTPFTATQGGVDGAAANDLATVNNVTQAIGNYNTTVVDPSQAAQDAIIAGKADSAALAQEVADRTAGDTALDGRINALSIVGTGVATVTESAADSGIWTVDVPAISLANTYTGPGTDSASINTDLTGKGITPQAGDLYINDTAGTAFLNSGLAAPGDWVALATAAVGVDSITGGDGSVTVTNGAGPVADVALSAALQAEIAASTATNVTQDGRLDGIDAAQIVQDGRLDAVEAANGTQDAAIALKADITYVDSENTAQDTVIASKVASVGVTAPITNTGTPTAPVIGIDTSALAGVSKKFAADLLIQDGPQTVAHGLGADVTVAVWVDGCLAQASVCATATDVTIDANLVAAGAASARVVIVG